MQTFCDGFATAGKLSRLDNGRGLGCLRANPYTRENTIVGMLEGKKVACLFEVETFLAMQLHKTLTADAFLDAMFAVKVVTFTKRDRVEVAAASVSSPPSVALKMLDGSSSFTILIGNAAWERGHPFHVALLLWCSLLFNCHEKGLSVLLVPSPPC